MSYKAIIMEITPEYCLAMAEDGAILRIRCKEGVQVGDRVYVLESDLWQNPDSAVSGGRRILHFPSARSVRTLGSAAAVVIICFALALYSLTPTVSACSVLSIDGRNSIQIELDESDCILTASVLHGEPPDSQSVKNLTGKPLSDALSDLTMAAGGDDLLAGYAVLDDDPEKGERLRRLLDDAGIVCLPGTAEDVKQARKQDQSLGFYMAERALKDETVKNGLDDRTVETLEKLVDNRAQSSQKPGGSMLPVLTPLPNNGGAQDPAENQEHSGWKKPGDYDRDRENDDRNDRIDREDGDSYKDGELDRDDGDDRDGGKDKELDQDDRDGGKDKELDQDDRDGGKDGELDKDDRDDGKDGELDKGDLDDDKDEESGGQKGEVDREDGSSHKDEDKVGGGGSSASSSSNESGHDNDDGDDSDD